MEKALRRLGRQVRVLRRAAGLTQEETAHDAGLDYKHFQAVEAGTVNVTVASLVGIAKALHAKLSDLFA